MGVLDSAVCIGRSIWKGEPLCLKRHVAHARHVSYDRLVGFALRILSAAVVTCGVTCGGQLPSSTDASPDVAADVGPTTDAQVRMGCATKLAAGRFNTCAIDVGGALWCWGDNSFGQLAQAIGGSAPSPTRVTALGNEVIDVAIGQYHVCALKHDGTVWCWGGNSSGQIGDGTTTSRTSPTEVSALATVVGISAGTAHTCAVKNDGSVFCWGYNDASQLGDGTTIDQSTPVQVAAMANAIDVHGGGAYSCARKADGSAWCWGHGEWGELGSGSIILRSPPVQVAIPGNSVALMGTGPDHACGAKTDGNLYCWGLNAGDLGGVNASGPTVALPTWVDSLFGEVSSVSAGEGHTCVTESDGTVWCFGDNGVGELSGTSQTSLTPTQVVGVPSAVQVVAGGSHTCALAASGAVFCWGSNDSGELGDGLTITPTCSLNTPCERTPVAVEANCP